MKSFEDLERFVRDNRDEFDDLIPNDDMFSKIETVKVTKKTLNWWQISGRVAAAAVIFFAGYSIHYVGGIFSNEFSANQNSQMDSQADSSFQAFVEMQYYYENQINIVKTDIVSLTGNDEVVQQEIQLELEDLKTIFDDLKKDLNDQANNKEVIDAMIMNYRVKLKLLEDMRNQLNPHKNEEKKDYETVDI